ncbi:MAG: NDP-sugar synthase [Acidimicrobiaceae bacterium]|nr:NDP-sugar synthase [Acidimicrobiaceae bacterium]
MKSIILVGGMGTRLRPLTYEMPKQMLPLVGVPMIECVFEMLSQHGITEVVLSLGYLPDHFISAYPDGSIAGVKISYAVEPEPLDTAGAIKFAAEFAQIDETFLVVNGDVLTDLDVTALVAFHHAHGAEGTIALHPVEDPSRYGVVVTNNESRVETFIEKPPREQAPTNLINAGTYVFEPSVLARIDAGRKVSVEREIFPALAAAGTLYAMSDDAYWLDTGTPATFLQANIDVLNGRDSVRLVKDLVGTTWRHESSHVATSAQLTNTVVDRDCVVGENVVLEGVILMPGAVVHDDVQIRSSIIGPRAIIGSTSVLGPTCVVGAEVSVAEGSQLSGEVKLGGI